LDLYPAVDLRSGRAVRLTQGDYGRQTSYTTDPVVAAMDYARAGARWIHVVDLDAALTGRPENRAVVGAIAAAVRGRSRVQAGGGVRDRAAAEALLASGVARVVVGTVAVEQPDVVADLAADLPVAVSLDARDGEVAVRGWTQPTGRTVVDLAATLAGAGVQALVVTSIGHDGTLAGPDLDGLRAVLAATPLAVIASGGVGSLGDLRALSALEAGGRRLAGAIVGKALWEGRFSVVEAVAACGR
jgi:phosphoribosylformimino-5-aminoimidazole carboxamide ribotide isomerase